ncbi:antibiotic biosynthesis monooxygenase family protein [Periweissella fabalis]|uniref:ABM domain-containing protein n=1 Tax=Periweissella fabalis TaxID=1070421 RepID=A0A7X6N313_9LACO|nr:hypothetical protein [Periweissella fabalis]MCM0598538.1 hypothetical protein [Periweissella fabalis]NKZ24180.1 hypothetical protein [Periweissella fabalis]
MLKQVFVTYGSKDILNDIKTNFPNHKFVTLAPNGTDTSNLQLIDITGDINVFKSGVGYDVKNFFGSINWHGFFNYNYITVYPEYLNLFERRINSWFSAPKSSDLNAIYLLKRSQSDNNNYVILTVWNNPQSYQRWKASKDYFFSPYANITTHNFHESNYEFRSIS